MKKQRRRTANRQKKETEKKPRRTTSITRRGLQIQRIVYVVFAMALIVVLAQGSFSYFSLKTQERKVDQEYETLKQEKAELEENLKYINTPQYIEQSARDMLKMVMPGEKLYVLREKGEEATEETDSGGE